RRPGARESGRGCFPEVLPLRLGQNPGAYVRRWHEAYRLRDDRRRLANRLPVDRDDDAAGRRLPPDAWRPIFRWSPWRLPWLAGFGAGREQRRIAPPTLAGCQSAAWDRAPGNQKELPPESAAKLSGNPEEFPTRAFVPLSPKNEPEASRSTAQTR